MLLFLGNEETLELIEDAMFVIVLDENRPNSDSECCLSLLTGNPHNRWADKSLSVIVFENGRGGVNSDHTPMDAVSNTEYNNILKFNKVMTATRRSKYFCSIEIYF